MGVITVAVADDHAIWRTGVTTDLGDGFEVVGEAPDAPGAIELVRERRPDVLLCDLHMPGGGGIAVARAVGDATRVVMLTVSEAERDLLDAVGAGAVGYLVKSTSPEDLRSAVRTAAAGEPVFSPALAALVLAEFRTLARSNRSGGAVLTEREREVLQLVGRGHPYREIAGELFISEKTVENHVRNILAKLHLNRRHELVRYAADHDIR